MSLVPGYGRQGLVGPAKASVFAARRRLWSIRRWRYVETPPIHLAAQTELVFGEFVFTVGRRGQFAVCVTQFLVHWVVQVLGAVRVGAGGRTQEDWWVL
jgi:hypothetical protein